VLALAGRSFIAIWHPDTISGASYWLHICTSPELFIFVFFMMSDPQTAPKTPAGRVIYGAATAVLAAVLISLQSTEYGVKLAILASLTVVCALVPLIDLTARRARHAHSEAVPGPTSDPRPLSTRLATAALNPAIIAVAIIAITAVAGTVALASNEQITFIERGLTGKRNPQ